MSNTFPLKALVAAMAMSGVSAAYAIEAASMNLGGMKFTPTLQLTETYDDNFRASGVNEESTWITTINPSFELAAQDRLNIYKLTYAFNSDFYHSSSDDNNTDHHLDADAHMEFSSRSRLDLNAGYDRIESVADTETDGVNDKYHTYNIGGVFGYGAESATMQFELGANQQWLRYDNDNGVNDDLDRDTTSLTGTAFYRVAPKTRALLELRYSDYDYKLSTSDLDSDAVSYLVGVTWDATAKTSGTAKIGYTDKQFDSAGREDVSGNVWEIGVNWQPRSYSMISLNTRRSLEEGSQGAEDSIDTTRYGINWNHAWSNRVSTDVSYSFTEEDYEYTTADARSDETDEFGLGLNYNLRRWVDVGVGYKYQDVDSTVASENYDRSLYQLKLTMGL